MLGDATDSDRAADIKIELAAVAVWTGELESVTVAVTVNVPTVVGVPAIAPPPVEDSPGGSPVCSTHMASYHW